MLPITYVLSLLLAGLGVVRVVLSARAFLQGARKRDRDSQAAAILSLLSGWAIALAGVQLLLIANYRGLITEQGGAPIWPGVAALILTFVRPLLAKAYRR